MKFIRSLLLSKRGVSSLEYAILAAIVVGLGAAALGNKSGTTGMAADIKSLFSTASSAVSSAAQ
jgi:hypothetical protein